MASGVRGEALGVGRQSEHGEAHRGLGELGAAQQLPKQEESGGRAR